MRSRRPGRPQYGALRGTLSNRRPGDRTGSGNFSAASDSKEVEGRPPRRLPEEALHAANPFHPPPRPGLRAGSRFRGGPRRVAAAVGAGVGAALIAVLLAACGTAPAAADGERTAASQAALLAVQEALDADASRDGIELTAARPAASSETPSARSVDPIVVIRRSDMQRRARLLTLELDLTRDPPVAVAEVEVAITGTAELWEVYPDLSGPKTKVGEKAIDLRGSHTLTLERIGGRWIVVEAVATTRSQGEHAAGIDAWSVDPDPLLAGSEDNVATVELIEPDTSDAFLVVLRGRHLRPRGVANDNGEAPDAVADDDSYAGTVDVPADARAGRHLGFIHALNYTKTTDLDTDDEGAWLHPYTDSLLPVVVTVERAD